MISFIHGREWCFVFYNAIICLCDLSKKPEPNKIIKPFIKGVLDTIYVEPPLDTYCDTTGGGKQVEKNCWFGGQ